MAKKCSCGGIIKIQGCAGIDCLYVKRLPALALIVIAEPMICCQDKIIIGLSQCCRKLLLWKPHHKIAQNPPGRRRIHILPCCRIVIKCGNLFPFQIYGLRKIFPGWVCQLQLFPNGNCQIRGIILLSGDFRCLAIAVSADLSLHSGKHNIPYITDIGQPILCCLCADPIQIRAVGKVGPCPLTGIPVIKISHFHQLIP